jgi:ArsR family transcriptional regulator
VLQGLKVLGAEVRVVYVLLAKGRLTITRYLSETIDIFKSVNRLIFQSTAMTTPEDSELAKQLWAVGDLVRLKILRLLPTTDDCEHENNVSQLAEKLGLTQPTISHHLRILRQAGLVSNRKMCRDVYYWIDREAAQTLVKALESALEES